MYNTQKYILLFTAVAFATVVNCYAQQTAIGIRATQLLAPSAIVNNPSQTNVFGPSDININIGLYIQKYFIDKRFAFSAGLEYGEVPYVLGVDADREAFGDGVGGNEQINVTFGANPLGYVAATLMPILRLKGFELGAGPSVRFYNYPKDGFSELGLVLNRSVPYDPDDPDAGPLDIRSRVNNLDRLYLSIPVTLSYTNRISRRSQIKFGLVYNISQPLKGDLEVLAYNQLSQGSFNPRTNFIGVSAHYEFLTKKTTGMALEVAQTSVRPQLSKSIFFNTLTHRKLLSLNFDMRLKKSSTTGLGFSAGVGFGGSFYVEVTNDNKDTERSMLSVPVSLNYLIGQKDHKLEIGIGVTPMLKLQNARPQSPQTPNMLYPFGVGYRYHPKLAGLTARAAWVPLFETGSSFMTDQFRLKNFGLSIGYKLD